MKAIAALSVVGLLASCQSPARSGVDAGIDCPGSRYAGVEMQSITMGSQGELGFSLPKTLEVAPATDSRSSTTTGYGADVLFRVTLAQETGAVNCDGRTNCRLFETSSPLGALEFALQRLETPRTGEDILHPEPAGASFPIAVHALGKLSSGLTVYVEGYCTNEADCVEIAENLEFVAQ